MNHKVIRQQTILVCIFVCILITFGSQGVRHFVADLRENQYYCQTKNDSGNYDERKECKSFLYRIYDDPIAIFTVVLTIATIGLFVATHRLWRDTRRLVDGAENTARRQLRAYLSIAASEPGPTSLDDFEWVGLAYTNHGQTPAYRCIVRWFVFTTTIQRAEHSKATEFDHLFAWTNGPDVVHSQQEKLAFINLEDIQPVQATNCICIAGIISYVDFQNGKYTTRFRQRWRSHGGKTGWSFCSEGNEAD